MVAGILIGALLQFIFDDSGESCLGDIVEVGNTGSFKCQGGYDYNNAHDGLVIHLAEDEVEKLNNVTLDVVNPAENIEGWQILDAEADLDKESSTEGDSMSAGESGEASGAVSAGESREVGDAPPV